MRELLNMRRSMTLKQETVSAEQLKAAAAAAAAAATTTTTSV